MKRETSAKQKRDKQEESVRKERKPSLLEIVRLASDGSGVGYLDGKATFVPGMLPGETGKVIITEKKKNYQRARLVEILEESQRRIQPPCSVFAECGGCSLQHMDYGYTLEIKQKWVEDALKRIGKVETEVRPVIGMEEPWRYRNKAVLHRDPAGKLGYYRKKSNEIVEFADCLLLSKAMNKYIKNVGNSLKRIEAKKIQNEFQDVPNNIESLILRESKNGKILNLLARESAEQDKNEIENQYRDQELSLVIKDDQGRIKEAVGAPYLEEELAGLFFKVSPEVFLQVNPRQTEKLYSLVLDWAKLQGEETVWDLYCGIGTISLLLAQRAKRVLGIEENPAAVHDAKINAEINALKNAIFFQGKVESIISELKDQVNLVVIDPPRAGMDKQAVKKLLEIKPDRIIYVSCDPATMARDTGMLVNGMDDLKGIYELKKVQPVDMFPWTSHVESIIMMTYSGSKGK